MRRARWLSRLGLIPLGVLFALLALEAALQVGALYVRATGRALPTAWLTGNARVLCLGDSNTYGIYLTSRSQAYPQQLEALWNQTPGAPRIEVLNLGYPGTNSSRLRRDLPRMLETLAPNLVIIMVGANDYWTAPVELAPPPDLGTRVLQIVKRYSRVYQLAYMVRRAQSSARLEVVFQPQLDGGSRGKARYGDVEFEMGFEKGPIQTHHIEHLRENLLALVAQVRNFGAEPVLMTYPSRMWNYGDANEAIVQVAGETQARLVDAAAAFTPACPSEPCPALLFPDHHPTARGYQLMAETLVRELRDAL